MKKTKTNTDDSYKFYEQQFNNTISNLKKKGLKTSGITKYTKEEFRELLVAQTNDQQDRKTLGLIKSIPSQQRLSQLIAREQMYTSNHAAKVRYDAWMRYVDMQKSLGVTDLPKYKYIDFKTGKTKDRTPEFWNRLSELRKQGWTKEMISKIIFGSP